MFRPKLLTIMLSISLFLLPRSLRAEVPWLKTATTCASFSRGLREYLNARKEIKSPSPEQEKEYSSVLEVACGPNFKSCNFAICGQKSTVETRSDVPERAAAPPQWLNQPLTCDQFTAELRNRFSSLSNISEASPEKKRELEYVLDIACSARFADCQFKNCSKSKPVAAESLPAVEPTQIVQEQSSSSLPVVMVTAEPKTEIVKTPSEIALSVSSQPMPVEVEQDDKKKKLLEEPPISSETPLRVVSESSNATGPASSSAASLEPTSVEPAETTAADRELQEKAEAQRHFRTALEALQLKRKSLIAQALAEEKRSHAEWLRLANSEEVRSRATQDEEREGAAQRNSRRNDYQNPYYNRQAAPGGSRPSSASGANSGRRMPVIATY